MLITDSSGGFEEIMSVIETDFSGQIIVKRHQIKISRDHSADQTARLCHKTAESV